MTELKTNALRSLQGKLILVIFVAVAAITLGRGYFTYVDTLKFHNNAASNATEQLKTTLATLIARSHQELIRFAEQYPHPSEQALSSGNIKGPSFFSGIESIAYSNLSGELLARALAEGSETSSSSSENYRIAAMKIAEKGMPIATIHCAKSCIQSVYIPIITDDDRELILNINRSIEFLIQDFYEVSSADIALLDTNKSADILSAVRITSRAGKNKQLLEELAEVLIVSGEDSVFFGKIGSQYYGARLFRVDSAEYGTFAIVIDNQSQIQSLLNTAIRSNIISTILTLFLVTSLISIILRPSLRRLVSLAQILPMLSLSQFDEAREQLTVIDKASKEPDEIDLLTSTTGELINALESMNENIEQHRHKLKQKITALTEANNFTDMLLDSSPLAIVVHDREGSIKNINRLGRQLTGLDLDILPQANINRWVKNPSQGSTISNTTRALLNEVGQKSQEEMSLFTADGEQLDYFWLHTSISVHDTICILSIGIDMTERRKAAESLRWLGRHDRVSGLLNRTTFSEEADHWISQHGGIENVNFLMLDVDHLAVFNDRFGFKAGDELLASIANRLTETLPEDSLIGRTGAGEFSALLLHNQDHSEEAEKSQLESLTRYFHEMEGGSEEVSLSAVVNPYRGEYNGIDELISDTSAAMNRLKAKSRGHLVYAIDEKEARISRQERYVMRSQLQGALDNNRFLLFYQPILDVANNEISHCECLIRLLDDDGEIQPPAQFLRIAAESGMMTAIDYAVIEMAMKQQRKWDDAGITTGLSINLTAPTLEQPDFHDRLQALLEKTGANPQKLIFEVVETDGIEDLYTANVLLKKFRAIGAKIAFDDFGVGFTSFEYVRELPVDYIKIDQSFIRFLSDRANDQALVKSMVEMSHSLGKHVIAEGVEDLRALEMLKAMGVEYIQGYYISKPMPINLLDLSLSLPGGGDSFKNTA